MNPSETLTATVLGAPSGEKVYILGVDQDPASRLLVRVAGTDGQETMLRPTLLTESRTSEMPTLPKLDDVDLMIQELNFWRRFWQTASPRKATAMERMAGLVSKASEERGTSAPLTVLQNAWANYRTERRTP